MKDTLHLTLKKKWFDMIASGEKKEEYREVKDYWNTRLVNIIAPFVHRHKVFSRVVFKNGYQKDARTMTLEIKKICYDFGKQEWGAEKGKSYHVISLGKILKKNF